MTCFASLPDSNVPSWFLAQSPSAKVVQTVSWGLDAQFGVVLLTVAYLQHFQPCAFKTCPRLLFSSTRSFTRSFFAAPGVLQAESGVCLESLWHATVLRVNMWTISLWSMSYLSFLCKLAVLVGRAFSNALEKNMVVGKWSRDLPELYIYINSAWKNERSETTFGQILKSLLALGSKQSPFIASKVKVRLHGCEAVGRDGMGMVVSSWTR